MIECIEIDLSSKQLANRFSNRFLSSEHQENLSNKEINNLITQANELGAQKAILYFDPKNPYPDIEKITYHINHLKMVSEVFSNIMVCPLPKGSVVIECFKQKFSCFVTLDGNIYPCKGLPLSIGNIHQDTLGKILTDSEVIENLKNHEAMIKGPCRKCNAFSHCYGCRGRTFTLTGDYLASDPLCPKNQDKLNEITYLPMSVQHLIPQKQDMRVVSTLLKVGERFARVESVFSGKSPFVKSDGSLEEVAYMEIMAQSAAVMNGFSKFDTDAPPPSGFLVGGQKIHIYKKSFVKDKLKIDIYKTARFGGFGILTATVKRGQEIIAEGEIKIYHDNGENNEI
jgi:radical SAM protein with 4Fe4S-binding SPASM domain